MLPVGVQAQDYSLDPNYGTIPLNSYIYPDPYTINVRSGGSVDASTLGSPCVGYISDAPDLRVDYQAGSAPLIIGVQSDADTTLVINMPDGSWVCDDDSGYLLNPLISLDVPASGQYDIWVGSYGEQTYHDAALNFTSNSDASYNLPETYTDPTAWPMFGGTSLYSGFTPDPSRYRVRAGGPSQARLLGSACAGYLSVEPTMRLYFSAGKFPLYIMAESSQDTTIVVRAPDQLWYCDDDSGGNLNPALLFNQPRSGEYLVWLGSYVADEEPYAELLFSELGPGR